MGGRKPLVDLANGGTLEDVAREAQGSELRVVLMTGMRMVRENKVNSLTTTCNAYLYTKRTTGAGSQVFVPLCMPMVGDTWSEVLGPLGILLDQQEWTDIHVAVKARD